MPSVFPKKRRKSEQFGIYDEEEETDFPAQKDRVRKMSGKTKYEKVADDEADAPDVGYPRSVKNRGGGSFATNYVSTTKYSRWSFLPKATIQQYKRGANVYLLFIAILCCIPAISPLMPLAAVMPVVFVLSISLMREGMEDYARYKHDEELNNKKCEVRNLSGDFARVMWKDVKVGDIMKIYDKDWIPADVLILLTSADDGAAFIDTMDLDGETNLKRRSAPKLTATCDADEAANVELQCVGPSGDLYSFDGAITLNGGKGAVSEQNLLLRSSRLRNTKWAVGIVVYTGQESKVMLNSRSGSNKQSALEVIVNKAILIIFVIQLIMAIISAILAGTWASSSCVDHKYLGCNPSGARTASLTFWTYIILLNSLIPASLIVTMEIVKVVHASFIGWDHFLVKSWDKKESKWRKAEAHTSALNEGLGQIDYIFSDKTGTLTENKMELRYVSVDAEIFGADTGEKYDVLEEDDRLNLEGTGKTKAEQQFAAVEGSAAWTFNRMLAVCQTVMIEKEDDGTLSYNADSPDEVALVLGGKGFGCEFTGREGGDLTQLNVYPSGVVGEGPSKAEVWRVLSVIPFSSKRKRMTVAVQRVKPPPESKDTVELWMKGADNVIMDRISKQADEQLIGRYNKHLLHFSMEGLRTLCFATKQMTKSDHASWAKEWEDATLLPPAEREKKFEQLASKVEDSGFKLVGCTAVEDKLQENVPETIVRLARGQIKLWVLTGDKQETAIEIGRSTNLLTSNMNIHVLNCESSYDMNARLDACLADNDPDTKQGLVVDGATLNFVLEGGANGQLVTKDCADKFVMLATRCRSVVVCRSSPLQKALVVLLVKKYIPSCRSLAVGDGANDVPMIRAASIGIGIAGLEGMQAARASDYSVQQFQDLDRLLLHHGRLCYFRIANMCTYFFYKSWTFTLPQWIFGFYCGYSGQTFYEALYVPSYNMFFTSMPVFARAVLDTDLDIRKANPLLPELYHVSIEDRLFNKMTLTVDLLLSFIHAAFCFYLPQYTFSLDDSDLWQMSIATYSLVIFVCTLRIMVHSRAFSGLLLFAYFASFVVYIMWEYVYDAAGSLTIRGAAPELNQSNAKFPLLMFLAFGTTVSSEMLMRWVTDNFKTTNVDIVRSANAESISIEGDRRTKEASAAQAGTD
jgi:phospholipid-translocating P-type ATPase (flippase)